jgi:hypothetical protein
MTLLVSHSILTFTIVTSTTKWEILSLCVENCKYQNNSYFLDIKDDVNGQFEFERSNLGTPQKMGNIVDNCDGC